MKAFLLLFLSSISSFVNAQKTLYFRHKVQLYTSETVGAYPITQAEAKGIKHVQFAYDAKGKLLTIREYKQNVTNYNNPNALSGLFKYIYLADTVYQFQLSGEEVLKMTEKEMIEAAYNGDMSANKFVYKAGKIQNSWNVASFAYARNSVNASEIEEATEVVDDSGITEEVVEIETTDEDKTAAMNAIPVGFEYIHNGNVTELFFLNLENKRIGIEEIYSLKIIDNPTKNSKTIQYFDIDKNRVTPSGSAYTNEIGFNQEQMSRYSLQLNEDGEIKSEGQNLSRYVDVVDYDKYGHPNKFVRCDKNLKPVEPSFENLIEDPETFEQVSIMEKSYSEMRLVNDVNGNVLETATYDFNGKLQNFDRGFSVTKSTFDRNGNQTSVRYFDNNNNMAFYNESAGSLFTYSDDNKLLSKTELGDDDKPMVDASGIVTTKYTYTLDQIATTSYFDANGDPMADRSGAHKYERNPESVQGADDGAYMTSTVYDINGRVIGTENADASDYQEEEVAVYTRQTLDDKNRIISEKLYDGNHSPANVNSSVHETRYSYFEESELPGFAQDNANSPKSISYFGEDGSSINGLEDYHRLDRKIEVTNNNYVTTTRYSDVQGNLIDRESGAIYIEEASVEDGAFFSFAANKANGEPVLDGYGIWKTVRESSPSGTSVSYFDSKNKPAVNYLKAHKIVELNEGNDLTTSYFSAKGKLANNINGVAFEKSIRDENYNILKQSFFSRKKKATINKEYGYHALVVKYDEQGNNTESEVFNKKMKPVMATCWLWDSGVKASKMIRVYTMTEEGYNELQSTEYRDVKGNLIPTNMAE